MHADVYVWRYALLVVQARTEEEEEEEEQEEQEEEKEEKEEKEKKSAHPRDGAGGITVPSNCCELAVFTPPPVHLEETTRASSYHVAEHGDLRSYNLTLNEAVDLAQNRPLWRLMSMYGAIYALLVVQARRRR